MRLRAVVGVLTAGRLGDTMKAFEPAARKVISARRSIILALSKGLIVCRCCFFLNGFFMSKGQRRKIESFARGSGCQPCSTMGSTNSDVDGRENPKAEPADALAGCSLLSITSRTAASMSKE